MTPWDRSFGKLRSLLANPEMTAHQRRQFDDTLSYLYHKDPERYAGEVVAYLESFRRRWPVPWRQVESLEEIAFWQELVPFATFSMRLGRGSDRVLRDPRLRYLSELRCDFHMRPRQLHGLIDNEGAASLRSLQILELGVERDALLRLFASPVLDGLTSLALMSAPALTAEELATALLGRGGMELRSLTLLGCRIGNQGARALADWDEAHRLEHLDLQHCGISAAGARALAGSPGLSNLRTLILYGNAIEPGGANALSESRHLRPEVRRMYEA